MKDSLNNGHLHHKDTVCSPNHIDCVQIYLGNTCSTVYRTASWVPMVSSIERFHCKQDSQLGPSGVLQREVPLYIGTASWVPMVSSIERFLCIQDSQLGPSGVLQREVPLYIGTASWVPMVSSIERFLCIQDS